MRIFKRILLWSLISLLFEFGVFYYFSNYYFKPNGEISITPIDVQGLHVTKTSYLLPVGAENVKVSSDGSYIAYIQNKKLRVMELDNGKVSTLRKQGMLVDNEVMVNDKLVYQPVYRWIPNRDVLLVGYVYRNAAGVRCMDGFTYNTSSSGKYAYTAIAKQPIEGITEGRYITDIQGSALSNVIYFKVDGKNMRTKMYRTDINKDRTRVYPQVDFVQNMLELQESDTVYFENTGASANDSGSENIVVDSVYSRSYVYRNDSYKNSIGIYEMKDAGASVRPITSSAAGLNYKIIGIDSNEKVYIAKIDENERVKSLVYISPTASGLYPAPIQLPSEYDKVEINDIVLTPRGNVYVNDKLGGKLVRIYGGSKVVRYQGDVLQITNDYLVTRDGRRLRFKKLK